MQPGEECERASPVSRRSIKIVLEFNPAEQRDEPLTAGRRIATNLAGSPYWKRYRYDNNDLAGGERSYFCGYSPPPTKTSDKGRNASSFVLSRSSQRKEFPSSRRGVTRGRGQLGLAEGFCFFFFSLQRTHAVGSRRTLRELARGPRDMTSHGVAPLKCAGRPKSPRPQLRSNLPNLPKQICPLSTASKVRHLLQCLPVEKTIISV